MPIRVTCQCGHAVAVPDAMAGKVGKCPKCSKPLRVPSATASSGNAPAAKTAPAKAPSSTASAPKPAASTGKPSPPKPAIATPTGAGNPLDQLLSDAGLQKKGGPTCPDCDAPIPPNAVICIQCGLQFETGQRLKGIEDDGPVLVEKFKNPVLNRAQRDIIKDEQEVEKLKFAGAPWWVTLAVVLGLMLVIFFGVIIVDGLSPPGEGGGDGLVVEPTAAKPAPRTFIAKVQKGSIRNALIIVGYLVSNMVVWMASIAIIVDAFYKRSKDGFMCIFVPFYIYYYSYREWGRISSTVKILAVWTVIFLVFLVLLFTSGSYRAFQARSLM